MPNPANVVIENSINIKGENTEFITKNAKGVLASNAVGLTLNTLTVPLVTRTRVTLAEMNAGKTLLTAPASTKFRLFNIGVIAIGGNAEATAAATGLAVYGTQAGSSVALYTALLAALTRSAYCTLATADTSILADGASFGACDANTSITCKAVSAGNFDLITATHFDIILTYVYE